MPHVFRGRVEARCRDHAPLNFLRIEILDVRADEGAMKTLLGAVAKQVPGSAHVCRLHRRQIGVLLPTSMSDAHLELVERRLGSSCASALRATGLAVRVQRICTP